jgi:hypothetical protein
LNPALVHHVNSKNYIAYMRKLSSGYSKK